IILTEITGYGGLKKGRFSKWDHVLACHVGGEICLAEAVLEIVIPAIDDVAAWGYICRIFVCIAQSSSRWCWRARFANIRWASEHPHISKAAVEAGRPPDPCRTEGIGRLAVVGIKPTRKAQLAQVI